MRMLYQLAQKTYPFRRGGFDAVSSRDMSRVVLGLVIPRVRRLVSCHASLRNRIARLSSGWASMGVLGRVPTLRGDAVAPPHRLARELGAACRVGVLLLLHVRSSSSTRLLRAARLLLLRPGPRGQRRVPGGAEIRVPVAGVVALVAAGHVGVAVEGHGGAAGEEVVDAAGRGVDGVPAAADIHLLLGVRGLVHVGGRGGAAGAQRHGRAGQVPAPELLRRRHPESARAAHGPQRVHPVVAVQRPRPVALPHSQPTNKAEHASETDGR